MWHRTHPTALCSSLKDSLRSFSHLHVQVADIISVSHVASYSLGRWMEKCGKRGQKTSQCSQLLPPPSREMARSGFEQSQQEHTRKGGRKHMPSLAVRPVRGAARARRSFARILWLVRPERSLSATGRNDPLEALPSPNGRQFKLRFLRPSSG
ncbi:hypothetical protein EJ04DRAFT_257504 [Polyplosphaeria fusca]|uniref:Uncharacterized protein n=1 Tax=Polyplosphaeria fusca TaxID=682080 RepID=A0A9P4QZD2_9PLEO|nr:hypothetical protein EJ04DRAFT_257504 [Polyplosphaeria fusca]